VPIADVLVDILPVFVLVVDCKVFISAAIELEGAVNAPLISDSI
tara:strand:- start:31 stop:162 length:132 start_codon:yes stop_codon:yes gene_type:complete